MEPLLKGRLSTVGLLVLISQDQLLLIFTILLDLNEEVNFTEPSRLASVPWQK